MWKILFALVGVLLGVTIGLMAWFVYLVDSRLVWQAVVVGFFAVVSGAAAGLLLPMAFVEFRARHERLR